MMRAITIGVCLWVAVGCASRDSQPVNYSVRAATTGDRGASLEAAEAALVGLGYSIARRDAAAGLLVSEPVAMERTGQGTVRADNPLRKIAEVRVTGSEAGPRVHSKVVIQEQATESFRLLAFERGGDDVPGHQTAIDRDAATTAEQNSVWRTVRRDKAAEREILDRLSQTQVLP